MSMSSPKKHKKKIDAKPDQSSQFDASTYFASAAKSQAPNTQTMFGSHQATGDGKGLPHRARPKVSNEQALGHSAELEEPHGASKTIFGLPTAPATPQPDNSAKFDTQQTKSVRFVLPMTKRTKPLTVKRTTGKRFTPTSDPSDASQCYRSITFMEGFKPFSFEELRIADYEKLNKSKSVAEADSSQLTVPTAVPQHPPSDVKHANESRSFFGLTSAVETNNTPTTSSLFESMPAAKIESLFNLAPVTNTVANDNPILRVPSSVPLKQDSNATSLFSSLPKITMPADFTFSKTSDKKSKMGNELSTDSDKQTSPAGYCNAPENSFQSLSDMATSLADVSDVDKTLTTTSLFASAAFKFNSNPPALAPASKPKISASITIMGERQRYMQLHHIRDDKSSGADEQLRTTPLISLKVKETSEARHKTSTFPQYAFLGCRIPEPCSSEDITSPPSPIKMHNIFGAPTTVEGEAESEPILLNTNAPWSAFICGSQGSGKSYIMSAMIESCLYPSPAIGKLPKPLAGVVFHNSTVSMHNICEAAHLVSLGVEVNVLVSRSNFHALSAIYKNAVGAKYEKSLNILPLVLQSHHLTAERMHRLMAFQEGETTIPLYMEVIMRILREMAITGASFSYPIFKANLDNEGLQPGQKVMMDMRLNLLESFLDPSCTKATNTASKGKNGLFTTSPGTLTIVDLSDPFLDSSTTCTLFSILLDIFLASRPASGLLVCLDEAHKFMKNTPAAETFTENLLTVIREQRHNACRIVIATQEPTISPKLLDLCSMTFVHRFTSPDWLGTLRGHLAGASDLVTKGQGDGKKEGVPGLFEKIIELDVGESLLFAPSAVLEEKEGKGVKLGVRCVKFKTRKRLGVDGGQSVLAVRE